MVGLSVILESNHGHFCKKSSQVISKSSVTNNSRSSSSPRTSNSFLQTPSFRLDSCYLCKQKLLPGKDIYMYKGDRGFCSVECRCRQIFMDDLEENNIMKDNNYSSSYIVLSRKTASSSSSESGSSSSSSMAASNSNRKTTRNRRGQLGY